jgi:UDP-galactopyranose mutase
LQVNYLIIGAGPTGLGAGYRLRELGEESFLLLERNDYLGGLAASFKDSAGFTWDIGGHVMFSHYEYYDRLVEKVLAGDYLEHQRIAAVRIAQGWVPYPFQNNIKHLPRELQWECVQGLLPAYRRQAPPRNFEEWIQYIFGPGVGRLFMLPYNFKVWATPPERMDFSWIGERVSVVDLEKTLHNLILDNEDAGWGPNNAFQFPLFGGTGEIFRRIGACIQDRIRLGAGAAAIDPASKTLRTTDGQTIAYKTLLNTGPLDLLVLELLNEQRQALRDAAGQLAHNSVYVAGVGVDGMREDDKCWMYFPEENAPFYRLTNFHNYSPNNAALPGRQRCLMAETSFSGHKPEQLDKLMDRTVDGLINTGMLDQAERCQIRSQWEMPVEYGYPVPTLERDQALRALLPALEEMGIFSRGRFGGWKYEVSNMDHSVMQGVEWAERMVRGDAERTFTIR